MNYLTLQQVLDQEKGPIWVLNRSSEQYETNADIFITFTQNGRNVVGTVPATWLPICLTERFPFKVIVESSFFTDALSKGLIGIIADADAKQILRRPGVDQEKARILAQEDAVKDAVRARGIASNVSVVNPSEAKTEVSSEPVAKKARKLLVKVEEELKRGK